ncbi:hypothetical protein CASFOL_034987 [Castilleja foliolosa]|uniref:Uncharacterized protein n=1 Tax=Castilleja foliolosa TaxID=1961234 RepID=A0ABD3BRK2_9LAMI
MAANTTTPLNGRVAIVTGASRGIGHAVAMLLRSLGAKLVINYASNSSQADLLASEHNTAAAGESTTSPIAITVKGDVSKPEDVKSLFDQAERHTTPRLTSS